MRCGCQPVWITDRRATEDGVTLARALSVGCSCCGAPSGHTCSLGAPTELVPDGQADDGVRDVAETGKHPAARWGDFCSHRLRFLTQPQGVQEVLA